MSLTGEPLRAERPLVFTDSFQDMCGCRNINSRAYTF